MRIRAVVFDLFITLTDFRAERCRPQFMGELAITLGVAAGMTAVPIDTPCDTDVRYDAEAQWAGRSIADMQALWPLLRELQEARNSGE